MESDHPNNNNNNDHHRNKRADVAVKIPKEKIQQKEVALMGYVKLLVFLCNFLLLLNNSNNRLSLPL